MNFPDVEHYEAMPIKQFEEAIKYISDDDLELLLAWGKMEGWDK